LQIIAIWNNKGRNCLKAYNNNWLKELAKALPEAKWKSIAFITTPTPLHLALKRPLALIKQRNYPATTFVKTYKAPKINKYPGPTPKL
jgi:hypothetical protein